MKDKEYGIINLLGKKYTYNMLAGLNRGSKRFKAMSDDCPGEKMRAQRLREMESLELINIRVKRLGRRPVSIYSLSKKGKRILKLAEELKRLESEDS